MIPVKQLILAYGGCAKSTSTSAQKPIPRSMAVDPSACLEVRDEMTFFVTSAVPFRPKDVGLCCTNIFACYLLVQPNLMLLRYEASKNRGTDAGSLDMPYEILDFHYNHMKWNTDPILSHALVAFHSAITYL